MAKVLLVEDDNNLREIYEARLQAEGYTIISAKDGEEALVAAKAEKPDLIISDVMMPKISGFEMLDILRNTPEIQATKVIMLTALGQSEDQSRASKLGADRYLVKSQVTLEDIVKASHELLGDSPVEPQPAPVPVTPPVEPQPAPVPVALPVEPQPAPVPVTPPVEPQPAPVTQPAPVNIEQTTNEIEQNLAQTEAQENTVMQNQINDFLSNPNQAPANSVNNQPQTAGTNPAQQQFTNETANDQTLAQAVNEMLSVNEQSPPNPVAPTVQPIDTTTAPATMTNTTDQPIVTTSDNDNGSVDISGKKIIQPLGNTAPQKSLQELVAQEEAKNIMSSQTGDQTNPKPFDPSDPNNVAL